MSIPDRLRGAGLVMIMGTLPWVGMPFAPMIGGDVSDGIGVSMGTLPALVVTTSMLPWLAPLSLATTLAGFFVYYGRGLRPGLALAVAWMVMGIVSTSWVVVVAGLVAYSIHTGRRHLATQA